MDFLINKMFYKYKDTNVLYVKGSITTSIPSLFTDEKSKAQTMISSCSKIRLVIFLQF